MRQFRELQTSFSFGRCVFTSRLGPILCKSQYFWMIVFRLHSSICIRRKKKASEIRQIILLYCFCLFSVGLSSIFSHWWKEQVGQSHTSHVIITCSLYVSLSYLVSLFIPPFDWWLCLDDGVPVKVVLDVICSKHASHLEVSRRQRVLLLLAQLAVMSWIWRGKALILIDNVTHSSVVTVTYQYLFCIIATNCFINKVFILLDAEKGERSFE